MAVNVFGASLDYTSDMIVKDCLDGGLEDVNGDLFQLITIVSLRPVQEGGTTHNFEDTFIHADQKPIRIQHRTPGRIKWVEQRVGLPKAQLARTRTNILALANMYYEKQWKILDPVVDAECKAIADEMISRLPRSTKAEIDAVNEWKLMMKNPFAHEERIREIQKIGIPSLRPDTYEAYWERVGGSDKTVMGGAAVNRDGKTITQVEADIVRAELNKRDAAIRLREEAVARKEAAVESKRPVVVKVEAPLEAKEYTYDELMANDMKQFLLRKIARTQYSLQPKPNATKKEVAEMIISEQEKRKPAPEVMEVKG